MSCTPVSHTVPWFATALATLAFCGASVATTITTTTEAEGPKSRAQVQAELDAVVRDGTFIHMRHNRSYPPQLDPSWRNHAPAVATNLQGTGEIRYDAPAAGVRSREEVQRELQQSREDGSLQKTNTNRGY
jgi:hypothetical protein